MTDNQSDRGPTGSERLMAQAGRKRGRLFNFSINGSRDLSERMMLGSTPQSIGAELRAARVAVGMTPADVARQLCLRQSYIEAIEEGDFGSLPGVAYAIGFVRSYARYLELDADNLIERFKEEVSDISPPSADLAFLDPVSESRVPKVGLVMVALLMAAVAYGAWYYLSTRNVIVADMVPPVPEQFAGLATQVQPVPPPSLSDGQDVAPPGPHDDAAESTAEAATTDGASALPAPVAPEQKPAEGATAGAPAQSPTVPAVPSLTAPPETAGRAATESSADDGRVSGAGAGSRIIVRAGSDSWIQIRAADESLLVTRTLRKGESYRVPNQPGLKLMTGNAGALEILVDGQPAPAIGPFGAVKRNVALDADRLRAGTAAN